MCLWLGPAGTGRWVWCLIGGEHSEELQLANSWARVRAWETAWSECLSSTPLHRLSTSSIPGRSVRRRLGKTSPSGSVSPVSVSFPPTILMSGSGSGFPLNTTLREKRSGHFDERSRRRCRRAQGQRGCEDHVEERDDSVEECEERRTRGRRRTRGGRGGCEGVRAWTV